MEWLPEPVEEFLNAGAAPVVFTLGSAAVMTAGDFFAVAAEACERLGERAVVHQGGVGMVAQCLRAGKPMLIVPWSHDQPDNAWRMTRLGVGRTVRRSEWTVSRVCRELDTLLGCAGRGSEYARRAGEIAIEVGGEDGHGDGCRATCDALERLAGAKSGLG